MPPQHHPLESDHHLHPEERDVVPAAADRSQHPREQRGNACGLAQVRGNLLAFSCFLTLHVSISQPWCRLITTIYNYFVVTNFFWMFVEGCYLHTAIVMTYSTDKLRKWVFLFIGWCECARVDRTLWTLHSLLGCGEKTHSFVFFFLMNGKHKCLQSLKPTTFQPRRCVSIKVWSSVLWDYANLLHNSWWEAVYEGRKGLKI